MSKRNPLQASVELINISVNHEGRKAGPVDEGEKTANDGDQQTLAIPTTSNSTARVDEGNKAAETGSYKSPEQN